MSPPGIASPDRIIAAVCNVYDISRKKLTDGGQTKGLCEARHVAFYLLYGLTPRSNREIGQLMGGRDHSTVMSGKNKISVARNLRGPEASALNRRIQAIYQHVRESEASA